MIFPLLFKQIQYHYRNISMNQLIRCFGKMFGMISVKCDALRNTVPLYNLKNVKITHGVVLLLVKLQAELCNFTKSNTSPWVFFTFLKL